MTLAEPAKSGQRALALITDIERANFKTFQFGQGQGGRTFQPEEYIEYFED
jgi:hypothetical protein